MTKPFHILCGLAAGLLLLAVSAGAASPLVSIAKSANQTNPKVLDTFRYSIVVQNTGGASADNTVVTDVVPAGLVVTAISAGGVQVGNTITWNLGSLSCSNQVVVLRPRADTSGGWCCWGDVNGSDNVRAYSQLTGPITSTSNWFLMDQLSGYSVNSVNSVVASFEYYGLASADTITFGFSDDGDLSSQEGSSVAPYHASDAVWSWDITGLSAWNFNSLQYLSLYAQNDKGGGGGTHDSWLDDMYVTVDFESCGTSVWYEAQVSSLLSNGDVVNNTADVDGSNYSNVTSNNVAVTVVGPELVLDKNAVPSLAAPGDVVEYVIDYTNQISGLSVFDDFSGNYGLGVANIPNWTATSGNPEYWENINGGMHHTICN
jgi:uncharacterized repeat protein (TIGR01451 family)